MSNHKISYDRFKKEPYMLYEFMDDEEIDYNNRLSKYAFNGKIQELEYPLFNIKIGYDRKDISRRVRGSEYTIGIIIKKKINKELEYFISGMKKYCEDNYNIELSILNNRNVYSSDRAIRSYSSDIELEFYFYRKIPDRNFAYDFGYIEYIGLEVRHLLEDEIFPIFENYKNKVDKLSEFLNSK